jgi:hypothetical protein
MTPESPRAQVFAWMEVLERIQTGLGQSLQLAEDPALPPPADSPAVQPLEVLGQRLAQLQACLDRAEQNADTVDRLLDAEAEAVRQWLQRTEAVRQKVAAWDTPTVQAAEDP